MGGYDLDEWGIALMKAYEVKYRHPWVKPPMYNSVVPSKIRDWFPGRVIERWDMMLEHHEELIYMMYGAHYFMKPRPATVEEIRALIEPYLELVIEEDD